MAVSDGQPVSANITNNAFMSRLIDTSTIGRVELLNSLPESGPTIANLQRYINFLASVTGVAADQDPLAFTYSSEEIIANSDDRKVAIGKLDAQVKLNLDAITDIQNNGATASDLINFANDAAYELAIGAPTGGEIYYNTTSGLVRYYDGIAGIWKNIGEDIFSNFVQETPTGTVDGVNTDFVLSSTPANNNVVKVFLNGLRQRLTDDYTISGDTITFGSAPTTGEIVYVDYIT